MYYCNRCRNIWQIRLIDAVYLSTFEGDTLCTVDCVAARAMMGCHSLCTIYNCSSFPCYSTPSPPIQIYSFSMLNISFLKELFPLFGFLIYAVAMLKLFNKSQKAQEEVCKQSPSLFFQFPVFLQATRTKVEMEIRISDLTARHNEQLELEKKKSSSFCIKMRMQHRDCMARVGGVKRKLKEQNGLLEKLNGKLASLEWAEEDANDLLEELEEARAQIDEKEQMIIRVKEEMEVWKEEQGMREMILEKVGLVALGGWRFIDFQKVRDLETRLKTIQGYEDNKENTCRGLASLF